VVMIDTDISPSHNVTLADAVIAAVTVYYDLILWTLNRKHYPMLSEEQFFGQT
jgi:predicted nucleic acid-binding protein